MFYAPRRRNVHHGAPPCIEWENEGGFAMETTLDQLREGDCARIVRLEMRGAMRRRLLDFGMIEGTTIRCLRLSPAGDPVIYLVRGTMLALRRQDSRRIAVEVIACG